MTITTTSDYGQALPNVLADLTNEEVSLLDMFAATSLQALIVGETGKRNNFAASAMAFVADAAYAQATELLRARRACHVQYGVAQSDSDFE